MPLITWKQRTAGLIWTVLWLLCLEAWVRDGSLWRVFPDSQVGAYLAVEDHFRRQATNPQVVFMGSSRMRDAIAPRVVEHDLDLPAGAVVNLALTSGTAFDALRMYERNANRFAQASCVIIGLEDWWFNASRSFESMNRVRFAAGLGERLRFPGFTTKSDLVLGWFWRSWDARYVLREYIDAFSLPPRAAGAPGAGVILDDWGRIGARQNDVGVAHSADVERAAHEYLGDFRLDRFSIWALDQLVGRLREAGIEVFVVRLPLREEYRALVRTKYAGSEAQWQAAVRTAVGTGFIDPDSQSFGLENIDFVDYGHVARPGSAKLSRRFAEYLRTHGRSSP